jgi:hypothetical protein
VASSIGSPTRSARIPSASWATNRSYTAAWTTNRFGRDARLPVVDRARRNGRARRRVDVGARQHDERIAAAELEDRRLEGAARGGAHGGAGALAPRERHRGHARVRDEGVDARGPDEQRLERTRGRARLAEQLLERERALRHVRRVLEEPHVPGG